MVKDNNNNDFFNQPLNLDRFINAVYLGFYKIIFAVFIAICMWAYYYYTVDRVYGVNALLQVKESTSSSMSIENLIAGGNERVNLDEEKNIFLSNTSIRKLISELQLNILINENNYKYDKSKVISIPYFTFKNDYVPISSFSDSIIYESSPQNTLEIKKTKDGYIVLDNVELNGELFFGELYVTENFSLIIDSIDGFEIGEVFQVHHYPIDSLVDRIRSKLNVTPVTVSNLYWNQGSLLNIFVKDSDYNFAKKLINTACLLYIDNSIDYNVAEAERSLNYLNNQIARVEDTLKESEGMLNEFQTENTTINFDLEVQSIINQSNSLNTQINSLVAKKVELLSLYLPNNNIIKNLDIQIDQISSQLDSLSTQIQSLPKKQQEFLQLSRDVALNKEIFETLLQKRMEFSLIEASTIGNARIIDTAYVTGKVTPTLVRSLGIAVILSLFLSISLILFNTYFFDRISLASEIQAYDKNISILGMIPDFSNNLPETIDDFNIDSMQAIATNINIISSSLSNNQCTTIEIISATESVGKSSVSLIAANNLSRLNKKVLLIDLDLYKGRLGKYLSRPTSITVEQFNSTKGFSDFKVNDNLYFVPRVKMNEQKTIPFLESAIFNDFILRAKKEFEFIIIDTPPVLYKSDGISLAKYADIVLPVLRQKESRLIHIKQIKDIMSLSAMNISYIIFNGIKKLTGYYYTNYDYSSYKYYSSDYSYEEENNE